ncbi:MAG: ISL3 family transposase [Dehalococcoidia bacterium]
MQLETVLNRCLRFKGFVYKRSEFNGKAIMVMIEPRKGCRPECSACGTPGPGYDHEPGHRVFEHIPVWGFRTRFVYRMRRVSCVTCGRVVVERVPWATGKHHTTDVYRCYLANWAKVLSWTEVARRFRTCWQTVFRSVQSVVEYGLAHRDLGDVRAIGIDELAWKKGHGYVTAVYQIDRERQRLLWIGEHRTESTMRQFFAFMESRSPGFSARIRVVCSDMWRAYLKTIRVLIPQAVHVLDRFHIMQHFSKALDKIRAEEARRLRAEGQHPLIKNTRWCLLKRPENLSSPQRARLGDLLRLNLRITRAYLLKEQFQLFWQYKSPFWAGRFLDTWCRRTMRSRLKPMKSIALMLRSHRELILNWFRLKKAFSSSIVEASNNKFKLTIRKAFGFRSFDVLQIAVMHQLGKLPEPVFAHEFW